MYPELFKRLLPVCLITFSWTCFAKSSVHESQQDIETPQSPLLTLGEIDGESTSKMSLVTIRLDQIPAWKTIEPIQNHGSFLQLNLPGTIVPEPGKFYDGGNPYLPKIGAFQISPSDTGIRLFASASYEASALLKAVKTELLGSRLVVTIDPAQIMPISVPPKEPEVGPPYHSSSTTAEDVIARTKVTNNIPPPAELLQESSPKGAFTLRTHLTQLATGGAFLAVVILLSVGLKLILRRRASLIQKSDPSIALKTLASLPLAARQKISVIQVGNERILLGLTSDSITFLTSLSQGSQASSLVKSTSFSTPQLPSSTEAIEQAKPAHRKSQVRLPDKNFSDLMNNEGTTLIQANPPRLKKIPGNDEENLQKKSALVSRSEHMKQSLHDTTEITKTRGNRINIAVGEDGIKSITRTKPSPSPKSTPPAQEAIDDVTRLIREKLKNLKSI